MQWAKGLSPYMTYYVAFYVVFFGCIGHKEERFMLPVFPFLMIMTGELWHEMTNASRKCVTFVAFILKAYCVAQVSNYIVLETYFRGGWKVKQDLAKIEPPIHSAYLSEPLWTPNFSILHRQDDPKI